MQSNENIQGNENKEPLRHTNKEPLTTRKSGAPATAVQTKNVPSHVHCCAFNNLLQREDPRVFTLQLLHADLAEVLEEMDDGLAVEVAAVGIDAIDSVPVDLHE